MKHERKSLIGFLDLARLGSDWLEDDNAPSLHADLNDIVNCEGFSNDVVEAGLELAEPGLRDFIAVHGHYVEVTVDQQSWESELLAPLNHRDNRHLMEIGFGEVKALARDTGCSIREASINIAADQMAEFLTYLVRISTVYKVSLPDQSVDADTLKARYAKAICDEYGVPQLIGSPYVG